MGFGKNKVDTGDNDGSGSRLRHLRMARKLKREPVESAPVAPALLVLRRWQSERLARTHADFLKKPNISPRWSSFWKSCTALKTSASATRTSNVCIR
jgi:hypothetical protein